jgi:hypothetical protein
MSVYNQSLARIVVLVSLKTSNGASIYSPGWLITNMLFAAKLCDRSCGEVTSNQRIIDSRLRKDKIENKTECANQCAMR